MMRPIHRLATLSAALILAACSSGGGSPTAAPTVAPTAAGPVVTPAPAATAAPAVTSVAAPCADSTDPTAVAVSVEDNTWSQPVGAKVGEVITWANGDRVPHRVVLDDGSCGMTANIAGGASRSLVFSAPGTYAFHCGVHGTMTGVITIE